MTDEAMQLLAERVANFEGSCYASDAVNDRLSLAQGYLALTDRLTAVEAERDEAVARMPTEEPVNTVHLNAYGRRCYVAGQASAKVRLAEVEAERDQLKSDGDYDKSRAEKFRRAMEAMRSLLAEGKDLSQCSCWLGTSSILGSSEARMACAVHGEPVPVAPPLAVPPHPHRYYKRVCWCGEAEP